MTYPYAATAVACVMQLRVLVARGHTTPDNIKLVDYKLSY
jgi:hypothetical protein